MIGFLTLSKYSLSAILLVRTNVEVIVILTILTDAKVACHSILRHFLRRLLLLFYKSEGVSLVAIGVALYIVVADHTEHVVAVQIIVASLIHVPSMV